MIRTRAKKLWLFCKLFLYSKFMYDDCIFQTKIHNSWSETVQDNLQRKHHKLFKIVIVLKKKKSRKHDLGN